MQAQDGDHGFEQMIAVGEHKLLLIPSNACRHMDLTLWEKDLVVLTIFFFSVLGAAPSMVREDHLCNQGQGCYV
ncbi:unnamed protein product [Sphagnum troendelagicum]